MTTSRRGRVKGNALGAAVGWMSPTTALVRRIAGAIRLDGREHGSG
jgi:hypothetical protein